MEQGGGMRYIHYGCTSFDRSKFQEIKNEPYFCKPKGGLWASPIDAKHGWKNWCEAENFRECSQDNSFSFTLRNDARVYHIRSVTDVKAMPQTNTEISVYYVPNFEKMLADGWDAIELHLSECGALYWALYGWDCDCILVLNPDIVEVK